MGEQQVESLQTHISELETQLGNVLGPDGTTPAQTVAYDNLLTAYVAYNRYDYNTAGAFLEVVDSSLLSEGALSIYNEMWDRVSGSYYQELYNAGYYSFAQANYTDAIDKLLRVVKYDPGFYGGDAVYYLAQAYHKTGDNTTASFYFQYVVDNYPDTEKAMTAQEFLNQN